MRGSRRVLEGEEQCWDRPKLLLISTSLIEDLLSCGWCCRDGAMSLSDISSHHMLLTHSFILGCVSTRDFNRSKKLAYVHTCIGRKWWKVLELECTRAGALHSVHQPMCIHQLWPVTAALVHRHFITCICAPALVHQSRCSVHLP